MLVAVLGGDDEAAGPAGARQAPSALERQVAALIQSADVRAAELGDVEAFRRPRVTEVECADGACAVAYVIGLPGAGRIREDQATFLAPLFDRTDVQRIRLRVFRNVVVGPDRRLKAEEETPAGTPLLDTTCDRAGAGDVDWRGADAVAVLDRLCRTTRFSPSGAQPAPLEPPGRRPEERGS